MEQENKPQENLSSEKKSQENDSRPKMDIDIKRKIIFGGLVLIVVLLAISFQRGQFNLDFLNSKKQLTSEEAKSKVVDFVTNNMIQPGTKLEVKSVAKEDGLYKITLSVGAEDIDTYITVDGKSFFPSSIDIDKEKQKIADAKKAEEDMAKNMPKTEKPVVDLYVMSFCPFGNQAEDTMMPAYALLKNKVDFNFRYIVNTNGNTVESLHGQKEVEQNEREACVLKNNGKDKWMEFVTYVNAKCGSDGACWEEGARSAKLDTAKIKSCVASSGLALMKEDEKAANAASASGSPTMMINGVSSKAVYQYGNSEAYKQAICDAFNTAPAECEKALSAQTSTTQGGSCN